MAKSGPLPVSVKKSFAGAQPAHSPARGCPTLQQRSRWQWKSLCAHNIRETMRRQKGESVKVTPCISTSVLHQETDTPFEYYLQTYVCKKCNTIY